MSRETVFGAILVVVALSAWGLGMWNFFAIGKNAGIQYRGPASAIRIYKHAFTEMRSSRETKLMVIGFVGMLGFPALLTLFVYSLARVFG